MNIDRVKSLTMESLKLLVDIEERIIMHEPKIERINGAYLIISPLGKEKPDYAKELIDGFKRKIDVLLRKLNGEDVDVQHDDYPLCYLAELNPTSMLLHKIAYFSHILDKIDLKTVVGDAEWTIEWLDMAIKVLKHIYSRETIKKLVKLQDIMIKIKKELEA